MEKYFHVDHAMRTCITASTNLVMKSQRYAKSQDFFNRKTDHMFSLKTNVVVFGIL